MLPVTETDTIVVRSAAQVKDDTKDNEAGDGDDFDGAREGGPISAQYATSCKRHWGTYAKMNSHSPYTPAPNRLIVTTTTRHIVIHTALFTD